MTTQPPEAVKLASEYRETMPADVLRLRARDAVDEMRLLHEEVVDLRVLSSSLLNKNRGLQLAVWAVQNANSALQARVQELEAERDRFRDAHRERMPTGSASSLGLQAGEGKQPGPRAGQAPRRRAARPFPWRHGNGI